MLRRVFEGESDLAEMQRIVQQRTRAMGPCTNLHPGDVAHRIYSGSRNRDLDEVIPVWEDESGIAGFGILWPSDEAFDVATRMDLAPADLAWIVEDIAALARLRGRVETDVIGRDTALIDVLTAMEFEKVSDGYMVTQQSLDRSLDVPAVDFAVRSVTFDDVVQLAAVHSGSFGSSWSAEAYASRMRMPGYDPDNEIVAVSGDGTFMGFTVTWYDEVNKVGYFEPVGVHRDFHRRGIGSALLREGMRRMYIAGMATATVWHASDEEREVGFYRSNGFEAAETVSRWERKYGSDDFPAKRIELSGLVGRGNGEHLAT